MIQARKQIIGLLLFAFLAAPVLACPFCSAVSQTFSEEMQTMDVVVICELLQIGEYNRESNSNPQAEIPKSVFLIKKVIKGKEFVTKDDTFDCIYFGEPKKDRSFLAMATDAPKLQWSTPLILTDRAEEYLGRLKELNAKHTKKSKDLKARSDELAKVAQPQTRDSELDIKAQAVLQEKTAIDAQLAKIQSQLGVERLEFFQDYLEDEDEMLARDAYDEFAKAPYAEVQALKPDMDHQKLLGFIKNPDVPSNRRRLYFTMLGVCGTQSDAALLEEFMRSGDRKKKAGLDALLACYLILTGEEGLQKVEDQFLKDETAEYADTYAAIMAIRFHGSEVDVIPRGRLTKSLHYMLERPELADLVIPDLARWEDWSVIPKLVDLFTTADENSSWVRVPVVNYLRACPLPIAADKIELLKTIDAEAVKRAMTFFPITVETETKSDEKVEDKAEERADKANAESPPANSTSLNQPGGENTESKMSVAIAGSSTEVAQVISSNSAKSTPMNVASVKVSKSEVSIAPPDTLNQVESLKEQGPNFWKLLGVMMLCGAACFVAMRTALVVPH